jgi:uncharacterized membrane protein YfcA
MGAVDLIVVGAASLMLGVVNSIAGGGSLLFFPALLAIGLPPLPANVTNSVVVLPGFAGAVYGFRAELRREPRRRLVVLSLVSALGAVSGAALLLVTPSSAFDLAVPVLVLFASILLALQPRIREMVSNTRDTISGAVFGKSRSTLVLSISMFAACVYGGYFGGALGVIMLVVLALTTSEGLHSLNALKSGLSLVVSTVILPVFALFGPVHWWIVALGAPASLLGGVLGARIARRMDERVLRWCVVLVGVSVSVYLFLT